MTKQEHFQFRKQTIPVISAHRTFLGRKFYKVFMANNANI